MPELSNPLVREVLVLTAVAMLAVGASPWVLKRLSRRLRPGDLIRISGGHEEPAPWLTGRSHVEGQVLGFVLGASAAETFAVVRLAETLEVTRPVAARGAYAILGLRFRGARWGSREVVAVWLQQGAPPHAFHGSSVSLVETHAWYRRVA